MRWVCAALWVGIALGCAGIPDPTPTPDAAPGSEPVPAAPTPTAPSADEAVALVTALYAPYLVPGGTTPALETLDCWSTPLRKKLVRDRKESERTGELGRLDFDPVIWAQDYEISGLTVRSSGENEVTAAFGNFGTPVEVRYTLVVEDGAWRIDDVRSGDSSLRDVLKG